MKCISIDQNQWGLCTFGGGFDPLFFPEEEPSLPGTMLPSGMLTHFEALNMLRDKIITDYTQCIFINTAVMQVTFKTRLLLGNGESGSGARIGGKSLSEMLVVCFVFIK